MKTTLFAGTCDHSKQMLVKGIDFLSCLYQTKDLALPIGFDLIKKTEIYIDPKDGKQISI